MTKMIRLAFLLALATLPVFAQKISFAVKMGHDAYIVGEPVSVQVKIANLGIEPVIIDEFEAYKDNKLYFSISKDGKSPLPQRREGKIVQELSLEKDTAEAFEVNLSEWYRLLEEGHYVLKAVLVNNNMRYTSAGVSFDIVPGLELASVSQFLDVHPPVERTLRLVYWNRDGREFAFLRAVDSTGVIWQTINLGYILRVRRPSFAKAGGNAFYIYRQASRDMLVRTEIVSDEKGVMMKEQLRAVDSVSSPMVDSLREAVQNAAEKKKKNR